MNKIRNRIWVELTQSKHNIEFSSLYSSFQRRILRVFNIAILMFSSSGIMGWAIWKEFPLVVCIIIALISLLKLLQPQLIMDEKQLKRIDDIHKFYSDYFNKIEKLWFDYESKRIPEEKAAKIFFKLKETESNIHPMITETIKSTPKRVLKKSKENSDNYFKQIFNI